MEKKVIARCIEAALEARQYAYAPYSAFMVGAALLCGSGALYSGCNVENASFSPSCCAERTAFVKAVSAGERDFAAIAVVGGAAGARMEYCMPCGVCRQVMNEFCAPDAFTVIVARTVAEYRLFTLGELLPHPFVCGSGEET